MTMHLTHPIRDAAGTIHKPDEQLELVKVAPDAFGRVLIWVRDDNGHVIITFPEEVKFDAVQD